LAFGFLARALKANADIPAANRTLVIGHRSQHAIAFSNNPGMP